MATNEQEAKRLAYVKAWLSVAGNDAARFTDLTIEEIAIARKWEAIISAKQAAAAAEKDALQRFTPVKRSTPRRSR